jgi:hypothetical protein
LATCKPSLLQPRRVGVSGRAEGAHAPDVLRTALSRLLSQDDDNGYLIYQLVVEGAEPAQVAAERGVSRAVLVEQLRDAVDELAMEYEDTANAHLDGSPVEKVRATLARKRG